MLLKKEKLPELLTELKKLYPESNADARFKISRVRKILFYCNKDGLYYYNLK